MNVKEVKDMKSALELEIQHLVAKFEKDTEVYINRVDLDVLSAETHGGQHNRYITVKGEAAI
ncbi:MAG: hypothetical protein U9R50_10105 [Campylobacterota bacterium]|nr:hypothetical protein [Campylobacterota bacterium]